MNSINISLDAVSNCKDQISSLNNRIFDTLNDLKTEMNSIHAGWISDSATTILNRFNQFSNRFDVQKSTIDAYAKFLEMTVSSYETLEQTINSNASSTNI